MTTSPKMRRGFSPGWAALISSLLCVPFVFLMFTAALDLKPAIPFEHLLIVDGYRPTLLGRVVMLAMLGSLPVALVINLLPMVARDSAPQAKPFAPTLAHAGIGLALLLLVWVAGSEMVLNELRPFVARLGPAAALGRVGFGVLMLAGPSAFLLNAWPRWARRWVVLQPTSINLIIGAVILLLILMIASGLTLEGIACSVGVPNCD